MINPFSKGVVAVYMSDCWVYSLREEKKNVTLIYAAYYMIKTMLIFDSVIVEWNKNSKRRSDVT
ncbi:MAG: hypothetical protein H6Q69_3352 [Firmicutes bacterium]|nr:hypothetical protein [Bacillota bacterium]